MSKVYFLETRFSRIVFVRPQPRLARLVLIKCVFSFKRVSDRGVRLWFDLVLELALGILRALALVRHAQGCPEFTYEHGRMILDFLFKL